MASWGQACKRLQRDREKRNLLNPSTLKREPKKNCRKYVHANVNTAGVSSCGWYALGGLTFVLTVLTHVNVDVSSIRCYVYQVLNFMPVAYFRGAFVFFAIAPTGRDMSFVRVTRDA